MPNIVQQISPRRYKVLNTDTGTIHSKSTTLKNAKAQLRLLDSLVGGAPVPVGADGTARCCIKSKFCNSSSVHYKRPKPAGYKSTYQRKKSEVTPPFKSVAKLRRLRGGCECEGGAVSGRELKKLTEASYAKGKERPRKIGDYVLDPSLTTREAAVYHNPKTGEATVTHRGTQGASDWLNNLALGVGLYKSTGRYARGKETQKAVNAKYGKENVLTTSHSQSGALAHELNKEGLVNRSVELNPARLPNQKVMKNETIIKSSRDPVSIFVPTDKQVKVIPAKSLNPLRQHSAKIIRGDDATALYGEGRVSTNPVPDRRMVGKDPRTYTPRMVGGEIATRFL